MVVEETCALLSFEKAQQVTLPFSQKLLWTDKNQTAIGF